MSRQLGDDCMTAWHMLLEAKEEVPLWISETAWAAAAIEAMPSAQPSKVGAKCEALYIGIFGAECRATAVTHLEWGGTEWLVCSEHDERAALCWLSDR